MSPAAIYYCCYLLTLWVWVFPSHISSQIKILKSQVLEFLFKNLAFYHTSPVHFFSRPFDLAINSNCSFSVILSLWSYPTFYFLSPSSTGSCYHSTPLGLSVDAFIPFCCSLTCLSLFPYMKSLLIKFNGQSYCSCAYALDYFALSCFVILGWQKLTLVISLPIPFLTFATDPGQRRTRNFTAWSHFKFMASIVGP